MSSAHEGQKKEITTTTAITDLDGNIIPTPDGKTTITFRYMVCHALSFSSPEKPIKSLGEDKTHQISLAIKIHDYEKIRLSKEDIELIKLVCEKANYTPLAYARICQIMGEDI